MLRGVFEEEKDVFSVIEAIGCGCSCFEAELGDATLTVLFDGEKGTNG